MKLSLFVVLFLATAFLVSATHGELSIAQTRGPSAGGIVFGLGTSPADPNTVYVDHYVSVNAGESWQKINGLPADPVHAIAVDPKNANVAYISIHNTLYKTTDGGKSVAELSSLGTKYSQPGWDQRAVVSITVAPSNSNVVYAGTTHGHLYKSSDAGQTWQELSSKINANSPISRIAIHPTNPDLVYVSTGAWYWSSLISREKTGNGLYKSIDGGENFAQIASPEFSTDLIQDVKIARSNPETIYITTRGPGPGGDSTPYRAYKSTDTGQTWKKVLDSKNPPQGVRFILGLTHVAVDPNSENTVLVSSTNGVDARNTDALFFKSTDGGRTWRKIMEPNTEPIEYTHDLEIMPNGAVYANVYYRPFMKSLDLGEHWQWAASGINHASIHALYIDPRNRERVFASTSDGALHSTLDGGETWQRNGLGLHHSTYVYVVRPDPRDSSNLIAGVSGQTDSQTGIYYGEPSHETGVYISKDNGLNWARLKGLPYPTIDDAEVQLEIYDIFIDPQNPELILAGTSGDGVYRSEDGGQTWKEANAGIPIQRKYWKPRNPEDLDYCQNRNGNKAYCYAFATHTTMQFIQNPLTDEIWYLTLNGVFISQDLGKTWNWLSDDLKGIHTHFMDFDPGDPNTIYMGTHQGAVDEQGNTIPSSRGLLISRDGGKTWTHISGEGPGEGKDIRAIAVDPSNPNTVIAATSFEIYISHNKGNSWQRLTVGNEDILRQVDKLEIDPTAKLIYAGTRTTGVWRGVLDYAPGDPASVAVAGAFAPMQVFTEQVFTMDVSVDNLGGQPGSLSVEVKIGNSSLPVQTASVAAGKATALKFQATLSETGSFPLVVNGQSFGNITAQGPPPRPLLTPREPPTPLQPSNETGTDEQLGALTSQPLAENQSGQTNPLQELLQLIYNLFKSLFGK